MIVPSRAQMIAYALAVPLAALAAAAYPELRPAAAALVLVFIAVILADAALSGFSLKKVAFDMKPLQRLTNGRKGSIDIDIEYSGLKKRPVLIGLGLPGWISSEQEQVSVALMPSTGRIRVPWYCTPGKRGAFTIDACFAETPSTLNLWLCRKAFSVKSEIRVYPGLAGEKKNLASLFLNRGMFGMHIQRMTGKGREFEKLREYIPGDSFEDIHWKATAKRHHPLTKIFQVERTQEVYVVIDASRLSARPASLDFGDEGAAGADILERYITASLVLGLAAQKYGDHFGMITFSDRIHGFMRARSGKAHYSACRDMMTALEPSMVNPDFEELFTFIRLKLRRRALIVFLTNLDDPIIAETYSKNINIVSRTHLVLTATIKPERARPLFSTPDISNLDDIYGELSGHDLWRNLNELNTNLARHGVGLSMSESPSLCVDLVRRYLEIRQRQAL